MPLKVEGGVTACETLIKVLKTDQEFQNFPKKLYLYPRAGSELSSIWSDVDSVRLGWPMNYSLLKDNDGKIQCTNGSVTDIFMVHSREGTSHDKAKCCIYPKLFTG